MVWATFRKSSRVNAYIIGFAIADAFANTLKLDLKRFDWSIQGAKEIFVGVKKAQVNQILPNFNFEPKLSCSR